MKNGKRLLSLVLALILVFSLTTGASAADTREQITAQLNYSITVIYNGEPQVLANANGAQVYPISYGGTTYVPIRAIGNLLGLKVDWEQSSQTVLLNDPAKGETVSAKTAKADSPARTGMEEIEPYIEPSITVKYNGVAQTMRDANGNRVYPILYGGTTYLPIRAVSNMLGIDVDWNQTEQTVILTKPKADNTASSANVVGIRYATSGLTIEYDDGTSRTFQADEINTVRKALKKAHWPDEEIESIVKSFIEDYTELEYHYEPVSLDADDIFDNILNEPLDPLKSIRTSSDKDVKVFSDTHIGRDWAELDWSTASDGYVVIKVNELPGPNTRVRAQVLWFDGYNSGNEYKYSLTEGEWAIPLPGGTGEYAIDVRFHFVACEHNRTDEENAADEGYLYKSLTAKFLTEISNPETVWLLSTPGVDFENAPKAQAKALELTKNCKTDAEKITAIFNWVSSNIRYDQKLADENKAELAKTGPTCLFDPNGRHDEATTAESADYDNLDRILTSKSGVCLHYAVLMAGMLRSIGIPCKVVFGDVYQPGHGWSGHAWVVVNPETGSLNKTALGAGNDLRVNEYGDQVPTGWIRLDPTFSSTGGAEGRAAATKDANYKIGGYY